MNRIRAIIEAHKLDKTYPTKQETLRLSENREPSSIQHTSHYDPESQLSTCSTGLWTINSLFGITAGIISARLGYFKSNIDDLKTKKKQAEAKLANTHKGLRLFKKVLKEKIQHYRRGITNKKYKIPLSDNMEKLAPEFRNAIINLDKAYYKSQKIVKDSARKTSIVSLISVIESAIKRIDKTLNNAH